MSTKPSHYTHNKRMKILGFVLLAAGLAVAGAGFLYGVPTAKAGLDSAQAMYEAQGVTLNYNEDGELVDRGSPEEAQNILALLEEDWKYPLNHANLDPDDPLVNTRDELMYQYAVLSYHILNRQVDVVLTEEDVPVTHRGVTYSEPGVYKIAVGDYYANLDRSNPIERQLRAEWDPMVLTLLASLSSGHANEAAGELALITSMGVGGLGLLVAVAGAGLVWVGHPQKAGVPMAREARTLKLPVAEMRVAQYTRQPIIQSRTPIQTRHVHSACPECGLASRGVAQEAPPVQIHRVGTGGPVRR